MIRDQHDVAQREANTAHSAFEAVPPEAEQRVAEIQSRLQQAELARSLLNDALKAARKQIEEMSLDLREAQLEQNRVRSILEGMGIHLA
jgi:chromosome segregation ATPase